MPYLRDTAIVLRQTPYHEHDARVVFFGREQGKLEAVARGVKKPRAKQSGHVEPFSTVEIMIAKGKALDKLAVAKLVQPRLSLRKRLGMMTVAGAFCDLVHQLTKPGVSDALIFDLISEVLDLADTVEGEPSPDRARLLFAAASLRLLDLLGYALHLERCLACEKTLVDPIAFVVDAGGCLCASCTVEHRRTYPKTTCLPEHVLRLLRFLRHRPLKEALNVTASTDVFRAASTVVEEQLRHTPLLKEPRGIQAIGRMLG
ncbi:MAG: DNA repair protein RecO [Patescibacteria group bacterium]